MLMQLLILRRPSPLMRETMGPPESPWQASLPPTLGMPAQIMLSRILPLYLPLPELQLFREMMVTFA